MELVLDYTPLTPQASPFIPNELGYPGYVAMANPLGILSVYWCTPYFVYASIVKIWEANNKFLVGYGVLSYASRLLVIK